MEVKNLSQKRIITSNCKIARSFFSRVKGLMFSSYQNDLLLISPQEDVPSSSIHMLFMRFPLDVIWINSKREIIDMKEKIPPFRLLNSKTWKIYRPTKPAKYVLELGIGKIKESKSKIGDKVEFLATHL